MLGRFLEGICRCFRKVFRRNITIANLVKSIQLLIFPSFPLSFRPEAMCIYIYIYIYAHMLIVVAFLVVNFFSFLVIARYHSSQFR